jgi:hypothetical protein
MKIHFFLALSLCLISKASISQDWYGWVMPRESQRATVMQRVGVTDITVTYHRPDVKGRAIWGGVVPFDKVWRAGANNATTFSTSTDISVEGSILKSGTYALFLIPSADKEWTVIFNSVAEQWGAFTYKEEQDAVRVKVKPVENEFVESMYFDFPSLSDSTTTLMLRWERKRIPIYLSVNLDKTVKKKVATSFSPDAAIFAMTYYYDVLSDYDEALKWANVSLAMKENAAALLKKSQVYQKRKEYKEALAFAEKALEVRKRDLPNAPSTIFEKQVADLKELVKSVKK